MKVGTSGGPGGVSRLPALETTGKEAGIKVVELERSNWSGAIVVRIPVPVHEPFFCVNPIQSEFYGNMNRA